jgi:hypothetical protein
MVETSKKTPVPGKKTTGSEVKKAVTKKLAADTGATSKKAAATPVNKVDAKTTTRKTAVKKEVPTKTLTAETKPAKAEVVKKSAPGKKKVVSVSPEQRYHMISTAAYFLAERRGFAGGYEMQDWISAEAEIDARLKTQ